MAHADDEFLSALLDGEPAPGDAAHVDGCEVCQARMSALRHASNAVASPVTPPSPHLREAALAAALRGTDEPRRVSAAPRRMNALSAAAVLVVALAVGGVAISQMGNGGSDRVNSNTALRSRVADSAAAESSTLADDTTAFGSGGANAGPYDAGELGEVNDMALVIEQARTDLGQPADAQLEKTVPEPSPCPYDAPNVAIWQATLTYNGEAAVAHLVHGADDKDVMQILRRADCSLIATQET